MKKIFLSGLGLLLFIIIASCKTVELHGVTPEAEERQSHFVEITFLNYGTNYPTIVSAFHKAGIIPHVEYYYGTGILQAVTVVSFACYKVSASKWLQLRREISSCQGFLNMSDIAGD